MMDEILDIIKRKKKVKFPSSFNKGNKKILYSYGLIDNIALKWTACRKIRQVYEQKIDKL